MHFTGYIVKSLRLRCHEGDAPCLFALLTSPPLLLRSRFVRFQARQPALFNLLTRAALELRRPWICTRHPFVSPHHADLFPLKIKLVQSTIIRQSDGFGESTIDYRSNELFSVKNSITKATCLSS